MQKQISVAQSINSFIKNKIATSQKAKKQDTAKSSVLEFNFKEEQNVRNDWA